MTPRMRQSATLAALAAPLAVQAITIARMPLDRLIQIIPDDAFYYLILARNRASSGSWTFDHQAPATGFHLAYAYLLYALDAALPELGLNALTWIIVWSAAILVLAALAVLLGAVSTRLRPGITTGLLLLLAMPIGRMQCVLLMETPLVIAAAALLSAIVARSPALLWAVMVGLFGSLARSDFIVLPGAMLGAALLLGRRHRPVEAAFLGGLIGLLVVALHSYLLSGDPLQASVAIKRHWGQLHGYDPFPGMALLTRLIDPLTPSLGILPLVVAVLVAAGIWACRKASDPNERVLVLGGVLYVPLAIAFYGFDAVGVQLWYFGGFFVPLAISAGAVVAALPQRWARPVAISAGVLATGVSLLPTAMLWPSQVSSMAGGRMLRDDPSATPVGGWNSGIAAWFSERDLVNLDGLVNDDVRPFAQADRLNAYLDRRGIRYVLDYPSTVRFDRFERLLGMSCGSVSRRLEPIREIENDRRYWWNGTKMTLYRLLPAAPAYILGETIGFDTAGNAMRFQGCGWDLPNADGARIAGPFASLLLPLDPLPPGPFSVAVVAHADRVTTLALAGGSNPIARWPLAAGDNRLTAEIPIEQQKDGILRLDFTTTDPASNVSLRSVKLGPSKP